ncbi:MAG: transcriptional regulator [Desulfurococcales archaeon]|nr:transcriptional regulator [Desulfurococcales archaeon]
MTGETIKLDFEKIPVKPTGAKEIRELEIALIIGTLFREDVVHEILEPREFTTWVDSLAVAAGALAREKAGYPISKIAEELGRTETTIRNHLQGKTKAGQLVRETYEKLVRGELKIALPVCKPEELEKVKEYDALKAKVEELESKVRELEKKLEEARGKAKELLDLLAQ